MEAASNNWRTHVRHGCYIPRAGSDIYTEFDKKTAETLYPAAAPNNCLRACIHLGLRSCFVSMDVCVG